MRGGTSATSNLGSLSGQPYTLWLEVKHKDPTRADDDR